MKKANKIDELTNCSYSDHKAYMSHLHSICKALFGFQIDKESLAEDYSTSHQLCNDSLLQCILWSTYYRRTVRNPNYSTRTRYHN